MSHGEANVHISEVIQHDYSQFAVSRPKKPSTGAQNIFVPICLGDKQMCAVTPYGFPFTENVCQTFRVIGAAEKRQIIYN